MSESIEDPEIAAMRTVSEALAPLDLAQQSRALKWASERFGTDGNLIASMGKAVRQALDENATLRAQIEAMTNAKPGVEAAS